MQKLLLAVIACSFAFVNAEANAQEADPFLTALSQRHGTATLEELDKIAGSREAMVTRLLELRRLERPPFVGIRAEKLLLQLADRADVQEALADDLQSPKYLGLARIVVVHIDNVPNSAARSRLARSALDRVAREPNFQSYARTLLQSSDPEVSRLARQALE